MIYILSILVCVYCSIHFDVMGNTHNRKRVYRLLLIWFIAVSGLQYMVGSDTPNYMSNYKILNPDLISLENILNYDVRYQPGWMLLSYLCRFVTEDFLLLKILIATFLNISIFVFFEKNTKYIFTAILLYALLDYLVLNFNVLRHSVAIGFALYAISAIKDSNWIRFILYFCCAYMFHNSALLLLIFPLIKFLKYNKYAIVAIYMFLFIIIYFLAKTDLALLMSNILFSGYIDSEIAQIGQGYLSSERLGGQSDFAIFSITRLIFFGAVTYYLLHYKYSFWGMFGIAYIFFLVISGFMPILWRFRLYVDFPFLVIISQVIIDIITHRIFFRKRIIVVPIIYSLTIFLFTKDLFSKAPGEKYAAIDQYYPYHSIFNPQINQEQMIYFESVGN